MSHIVCIGPEPPFLGEVQKIGFDGREVWSNLIHEIDANVLAVVHKKGGNGAGLYSPEDKNSRLVVSKTGRYYWFPRWSRLTSRQGWLKAIAGNYTRSPNRAEELWIDLVDLIVNHLDSKKPGTHVSFDEVLGLVRSKLLKESKQENRDLVISSPNWSSRYITLHETKGSPIHLLKITHPDKRRIESMQPNLQPWEYFPTNWLVSLLEGVDTKVPGVLSPKLDDYPRRLDIVTLGDYEQLQKFLESLGLNHINSALNQLGLGAFAEQNEPTLNRRVNVLLQALGLTKPRDSYANYLENKIRNLSNEGLHNNVRKILEERFVEIYTSWISAFSFAHGVNREEYLKILNKNHKQPHRFEPSFGSILDFIPKHQFSMKDIEYSQNILHSFSVRVSSLMSSKCLDMLRALSLVLNHYSHSNRSLNRERKVEVSRLLERVGWNDRWDSVGLARKVYDFIETLYEVNSDYSSARVPELMEVHSIVEDSVSRRAVIKSLRNNSTPCFINIDRDNRPREFGTHREKSTRALKQPKLQIGDRIMVLASTNPVLIRPWIKPM